MTGTYRDLKLVAFVFLFTVTCFYSNSFAIPSGEMVVSIRDKQQHIYELKTLSDVRRGRAWITYVLYEKNDPENKIIVYSGLYDGESGGCHRHELLEINDAFIGDKYVVKDLNGDTFNDIGLYITEANCSSGKRTYYEKLLLATDGGFKLEERITKEK